MKDNLVRLHALAVLASAAGACLAISASRPLRAGRGGSRQPSAAGRNGRRRDQHAGGRPASASSSPHRGAPQLLIDVPQSISVVSGDTLETQQATNFQDYPKLVPGPQLDQNNPGEGRAHHARHQHRRRSPRPSPSMSTKRRSARAAALSTAASSPATSTRSTSPASRSCAVRRARFTAPARSAACSSS